LALIVLCTNGVDARTTKPVDGRYLSRV
jgi:hypothetical protein